MLPAALSGPYEGSRIWAVVPFANESGVSTVDTNRIGDLFARELEQVVGLNAIPVNRVIFAMRRLELTAVATPYEAMLLLEALDVDAIVVGTVTAYDPYPPPTLGAAVQLYLRPRLDRSSLLDPRALTRAGSGHEVSPGQVGGPRPVAQAAGIFDAANHRTLQWLQEYAAGRSEPEGAFGDEIYLVSMELYTQFVSYRLIHDLLESERFRVTPVADASPR